MGALGHYIWEKYVPSPLKNAKGGKLLTLAMVTADFCGDMIFRAAHAGLISSRFSPDDVLPKIGDERGGMVKYPQETSDQYRARLLEAPITWEYGGSSGAIEEQLEAAGFTGATVVTDNTVSGPRGEAAPYKSHFWVEIPETSLTIITPAVWGKAIWGCFWWGAGMVDPDQARLFWQIVNKFKDGNQVCRGIRLS